MTAIVGFISFMIGTILGKILVLIFIVLPLLAMLLVKTFCVKVTSWTAKYFYIAGILLDFGLIAIAKYVEALSIKVKNDDYIGWLCLLLCILAFGLLINILYLSYEIMRNIGCNIKLLKLKIDCKLRDSWFDLKYRIRWKLMNFKSKIICSIKNLFRGKR